MDENQLWDIRAFVYGHFAQTTHSPSVDETATHFGLTHEQAASAYEELHQRHAFFRQAGNHDILMANPFSGVETRSKSTRTVKRILPIAHGTLSGFPLRLHADAAIEAACAQSGEKIHLTVPQAKGPEHGGAGSLPGPV